MIELNGNNSNKYSTMECFWKSFFYSLNPKTVCMGHKENSSVKFLVSFRCWDHERLRYFYIKLCQLTYYLKKVIVRISCKQNRFTESQQFIDVSYLYHISQRKFFLKKSLKFLSIVTHLYHFYCLEKFHFNFVRMEFFVIFFKVTLSWNIIKKISKMISSCRIIKTITSY